MRINKRIALIMALLFITTVLTSLFVVTANAATGNTTEFAGGTGTAEDPYLIETAEHLSHVNNHLDAHYKLMRDIVFKDSDFSSGGMFYNNGAGWTPIGKLYDSPFTGSFDGNNHTISNVKIILSPTLQPNVNRYYGLFGYNKGTIKNITVTAQISGQTIMDDLTLNIGGIAGYNYGNLSNCISNGTISLQINYETDYTIYPTISIGGTVGSNEGNIIDCYNTAGIDSRFTGHLNQTYDMHGTINAGGIAGNNSSGTIKQCYNIGNIFAYCKTTSSKNWYGQATARSGGVVGYNNSTITDCYNTGNMSVESTTDNGYFGGIAGTNKSSIQRCYTINHTICGGNNGTITNTYYLKSGSLTSGHSIYGMLNELTYSGFDFESVWEINNVGYPFPTLKSLTNIAKYNLDIDENTTDFAGGKGLRSDPFLIATASQLANIKNYNTSYFQLCNNILFTESDYSSDGAFFNGWTPFSFSGVIDGNGYSIVNLRVSTPTAVSYCYTPGLFSINNGTIKNLTIKDARYSINAGVYNGGVVCAENNGTIINCHSKNCLVVFNSCNHFGGIVGDNKGTIENCTSENAFTLDSKAGKIGGIASNNSGNIINCTNRTVIMSAGSDYSTTGGIVATNSGKIILCCNLASISTTSTYQNRSAYTGGIVGSMSAGEVSKCYNAAPISSVTEKYSSNAYSGGLVAYLSGGTISNSYNVGNVFAINNAYSGKAYVGGLMGYNKSINDSNNCYVISSVYASSHEETYSGIICGYSSVATIINCYFVGVQSSAVGYGDASSVYAVTREDLKLASTLPEFDFSNTWTLEGGAYLYPEIKDNLHVCLTHYEEVIPELKATCTADGHTSGIKCYLCGTIIEEPSLVEKLGHVFLNEWFWQSDENYHWNICNREGCYDICDKIAHVFDHDCDEQCNDCGYRRTITHTYNGDWINNDFCHWKKCDTVGCNSIGPQTTHYYSDNNCESICVCGYVNPVKHDFASSWKYDSTGHWHNCKNFACTAIAEKQEHSYSNSCDITCDCGYVRSVTHDFSEAWEHDASGHWHICLTAECNVIDAKQLHQYSNSCDTSCDCGYTRTVTHDFTGVWQKDDASHWHICKTNGCNITDTKVAHSYDNACDTTCECGYTRVIVHDFNGAWQKDEDGHWHVCENGCGTTETKNNHISNGTATETAPEVCTICGWIITPALGHTTHTPGIDWESDETDHWHGCIGCDEQSFDKAHHTDSDNNGTCDTCSYSMPIKPPTHIHTYGIMWEINAVEHWKECECGEKIDKGMHKNLNNDEKCDECDYILISYLQEFIEAVSNLSKDSLLEIEYTEMYNALQLYNKLTAEEKVVANDSFLVLQNKIAEYNEKADLANNELKKSTEIAFLPISLNFTFLAALLFLLKKKIWIN